MSRTTTAAQGQSRPPPHRRHLIDNSHNRCDQADRKPCSTWPAHGSVDGAEVAELAEVREHDRVFRGVVIGEAGPCGLVCGSPRSCGAGRSRHFLL